MNKPNLVVKKIKDLFIGRKVGIIDNMIFILSNKKETGWSLGNKFRNKLTGKRKYISNEEILFIGGSPRSGTNLLANLLRTFDSIGCPYQEITLFQDIKNDLILRDFGLSKEEISKIKKKFRLDVIKTSEVILQKYKEEKEITLPILNAPKQGLFINELFKYFPKSKFIFMVRDGRDVAVSMKNYHGIENGFSIRHGAKTWAVSLNSRNKFKDNPNYMEVRYEDLTENPFKELSKISIFLNLKLPSEKKILNYFKTIETNELIKLSALHKKQLSSPVYTTSVGRWKVGMSKDEKKVFKKIAGSILIKEGYEKNDNW